MHFPTQESLPTRSSHITPKKSLGQHFLHDKNIARNIVALLDVSPDDIIVEIGPGTGALTSLLAETKGRIIAVDIDQRALHTLETLKAQHDWPRLELVHADICSFDFTALATRHACPLRVVGNLPYNITSQLLFHLFDHSSSLVDGLFMMQKEVADRLVAQPDCKEYGILSIMTQFHAEVRAHFKVSPEVFQPKPNVWSRVVSLRFKPDARRQVADFERFRFLVRGTFGKRRKTMQNCLRYLSLDPGAVPAELRFLLALRPEDVTIHQFIALSDALVA